ncbi:MAG: GTPase HflX [Thermodesulfovibrio sp.]|nr:GTPase HflX [Thermodesulfovibrio sp.]
MPVLYGKLSGLKGSQTTALEKIYRRRLHREVITIELGRYLAELSDEMNRQIGILVNRKGTITHVIVGDAKGIFIPPLEDYPLGKRPLRGLRLIHTHLNDEPLNKDDITDLSLLRFDLIAALGIRDGLPVHIHIAHLIPQTGDTSESRTYELQPPQDFFNQDFDFIPFVTALENEFERSQGFVISGPSKRSSQDHAASGVQKNKGSYEREPGNERAILVSVSTGSRHDQEDSVDELAELARSSNVTVLEKVVQRPKQINPRYLLGEGKLKELVITAMNRGATLLIFDQDLNPSQIKAINELTELKVIDRSQLILDIFARRAHSRDGKVQVELAQLKYRLPRLTGKGTAMSKLMGGIGGRGPGEMKLEIDRRRVRDRITLLEKELKSLGEARRQRKARRVERQVPIVSIVGYTNAGKSTLLNALTRSKTFVEDKLFATLDTASRRLRFPHEREVIITDTVGFIRDLPKDLVAAFKSTLEELEDADLLLHVVDISNQRFEQHMASVDTILTDLHLEDKKRLLVFNKTDLIPPDEADYLSQRFQAIAVSAVDSGTFAPLLSAIADHVFDEKREAAKV